MTENNKKQYVERKKELASVPGAFVVISNTLESKYYMTRLIEYDRLVSWIKKRIGVDIDTDTALELIRRCREQELAFGLLLKDLRAFVNKYIKNNKKPAALEEAAHPSDPDSNRDITDSEIPSQGEDGYNPVAEAVNSIRKGRKGISVNL